MSHNLDCATLYINLDPASLPKILGKLNKRKNLFFAQQKPLLYLGGGLFVSVGAYIRKKLFFLFLGRGRFFGLLWHLLRPLFGF